jgi:hypothetical protein
MAEEVAPTPVALDEQGLDDPLQVANVPRLFVRVGLRLLDDAQSEAWAQS